MAKKGPEIVNVWVLQLDAGTSDARLSEACTHPDLAETLRHDKYLGDRADLVELRAIKEADGRIFLIGNEPATVITSEDDIARQRALAKLTAEDKRVLGIK